MASVLRFALPPAPETADDRRRAQLGQIRNDLQILMLMRPQALRIVESMLKQLADPVREAAKQPPPS